MAVDLSPPDPASLRPVAGVDLGVAMAGVRKANRRDLVLMRLAAGSAAIDHVVLRRITATSAEPLAF